MRALVLSTALALATLTTAAQARNPEVGGAPMYASRTIVANAVNSNDHLTLVAAVQAAGLVETLQSDGPFTVFAPTDAAFQRLPAGTVETLLLPENKDTLTKVLTCHVVAKEVFSAALAGMIANEGGSHPFTTVGGCTFEARMDGQNIVIEDGQGRISTVTIADVDQSNGVIHVVDTVLLPAG